MVGGGAVEGGGDDLALDRALHVGDLLRALVDEHDHEVGLGVVDADGVGDLLQDDRLTRLGRRDDESALPLADGRDQVDDPRGDGLGRGLQAQLLLGVEGGELGELGAALGALGVHAVDGLDADHGVVLDPAGPVLTAVVAPALMGRGGLSALADPAGHGVAGAQPVVLDELVGDVDVLGAGQVPGGAQVGVLVIGDVQDAGDRQEDLVLTRLVAVAAPGGAVPALTAGVAVITVEAVASALSAPTTAPTALLVVAVGLIVAVTAPARTLLGLDDGGPGGVGKVPHEGGLGVGVVLG